MEERPRRSLSFLARLGGALVAPRLTQTALRDGARGGVGDLLLLLALQVVAVQLPELIAATLFLVETSYAGGLSMMLNVVAQSLLLPVVAVLVASAVMGQLTRERRGRERNLDQAALSAVPAIALQLAASLAVALDLLRARQLVAFGVLGVGGVWFVVLVVLAVRDTRAATTAAAEHPEPRRVACLGAGIGVLGLVAALLAFNLIQTIVHWEQVRPVTEGAAPLFTLANVRGGRTSLSSLRGRAVLISFWASWCGPCLREMPLLAELQREHGGRLQVLAINTEGRADVARAFAGRLGAATVLLDDGSIARRFGVQTLPHLVLLGRDGHVRYVHVGRGNDARLRQKVAEAVAATVESRP
jgi:thiol-disulfide isomerase/thioredoxin